MCLVFEALIPVLSMFKTSFYVKTEAVSFFFLPFFFWCVYCKIVKTSSKEPVL